jgi:hypothetical protein
MITVNAEVSFTTGNLRQPGSWGKLLQPPDGGIYYIDLRASGTTTIRGNTTTVAFPNHPEDLLLVFGFFGYQAAGQLSSGFILLQIKRGGQCDCQFPGFQARFVAKEATLLAKAENDLAPIYAAIQQAGYKKVKELQDTLRKEGRDRSAPK